MMPSSQRLPCCTALLAALSAGCLSAPPGPTRNADDGGRASVGFSATDWSDLRVEPNALPRRPHLQLTFDRPLAQQPQGVFLLEGAADDALAQDLQLPPLAAAHAAREVACEIAYRGAQVVLTPRAALSPGATYTLALAGYARTRDGAKLEPSGEAWIQALTVADNPQAGARALATWPADGSAGVPTNLTFAALVFDGMIANEAAGVWLQDPDGLAVPTAAASRLPCSELDDRGQSCVQIKLDRSLLANTRYELTTGHALLDAHGAPVEHVAASFVTGPGPDFRAPRVLETPCGVDEASIPGACVLTDDRSVSVRVTSDAAFRLQALLDASVSARLASETSVAWAQRDLSPGQPVRLELAVFDAAGNTTRMHARLTTQTSLPALAISELRADPIGSEPAQEFVEVWNYGQSPIALRGFSLSDDPLAVPTRIDSDAVVYPGARALLVADTFDAHDARDVPPKAGALLVRVGKALGKSGLSNRGAALFLRDPQNRRVSAAPAVPAPRAGVCNVRITSDLRSSEPGSFGYAAGETCTPGW